MARTSARLCGEDCCNTPASNTNNSSCHSLLLSLHIWLHFYSSLSSLISHYNFLPKMTFLLPFPSHNTSSLCFSLSSPTAKPTLPPPLPLVSLSQPLRQLLHIRKSNTFNFKCGAVADIKAATSLDQSEEDNKVLVGPSSEEERVVVNYDWTEEWYPLYLTQNLPDDAPLGLTVFDKQVVLYKDGNGLIHCYEDRCPHR